MQAVRCNICKKDFKTNKKPIKIKCPHCGENESFSIQSLPPQWDGAKLEHLIKKRKCKKTNLAREMGVTRQTIYDWIEGQCPTGLHLVLICKYFNIRPDEFFNES